MSTGKPSLFARLVRPRVILVLLAVSGLIAAGVWRWSPAEAKKPVLEGTTTAAIRRGDLAKAVTITGQLSPLLLVDVGTQISGLIIEFNVDFNTQVKKGQVIAKIDPSSYDQALRQAEADLASTKARLALTKLDTTRMKDLRDKDMISQQEYDRAVLQLQQEEAGLLSREAAVQNARVDLDRCTITAPIDGVVMNCQAGVGKTVAANYSAPTLCTIAQDLRKMQIAATIGIADIKSIEPGMKATFVVDAFPDRVYEGKVRQIRLTGTATMQMGAFGQPAGASTGFVTMIDVDNPDLSLLPNMEGTVTIAVAQRSKVLLVPNTALRVRPPSAPDAAAPGMPGMPLPADGNLRTVYRLPKGGAGEPEAVQIELGLSDYFSSEVVSGLAEGDAVVTRFGPGVEPYSKKKTK